MIESISHVCSNTSRKVWTNRKNGPVWIQLTMVCVFHSISCLGRSFNLSVFLFNWIVTLTENVFCQLPTMSYWRLFMNMNTIKFENHESVYTHWRNRWLRKEQPARKRNAYPVIIPDYFNVKVYYKNNTSNRRRKKDTQSRLIHTPRPKFCFISGQYLPISLWPDAFFNWSNT